MSIFDRASVPPLARQLDAIRTAPGGDELASREHQLLELVHGARVLDVGCGTGEDARRFAGSVGTEGTIIAVDHDREMIQLAKTRAVAESLPIRFLVGDAHALPLDDGSVDRSFSSRLLHLSPTPDRIVSEMVRVTVPGGRIVFSMEPDWDTLVVDVPDRELTRRILARRSDCFANPWSGRRLLRLVRDAGLSDAGVRAHTHVITSLSEEGQSLPIPWAEQLDAMRRRELVTADEMDTWLDQLRAADAAGRFFAAVTFFTAYGNRR
ncbi:MAG: methyltransferase domain-containing protein [Candidatus Dormibacteria bacterium]